MQRFVRHFARIGTGLALLVLVFSCATVPGLREESSGTFIRVPFVRVLLDENSEKITAGTRTSYAIECIAGEEQTVYYSSRPVTVRNERGRLTVENHRNQELERDLSEVNIIPRGNGNRVRANDTEYRGIIKLLPSGRNVRMVNIVYMEDYLRGVVPPEIGPRTDEEIEAVKAQAVAARTYAMAHLQQYGNEPYDLKASIIDQVYSGVEVENRLVNRAINATTGNILSYHDDYVNAYYHSTCGGSTDDVAHVWDRKETPYLKPVEDSGACSWSKYYSWKEIFTEAQLRGRLEQYLSSDRGRDIRMDPITDIAISERTPGGRVAVLLVQAGSQVYRFKKDRIRWVIGRRSNPDLILPSDRFEVELDRDQSGTLRSVTFAGGGYGHGVGMCQCGAIGLARKGWTFDSILKHYYSGVDIKQLY